MRLKPSAEGPLLTVDIHMTLRFVHAKLWIAVSRVDLLFEYEDEYEDMACHFST